MTGQHDHHCILTCNGVDWRIIGCSRGGRQVHVRALQVWPPGVAVFTMLDLSGADMDAYCAAALAWDRRYDRQPV